MLSGPLPMSGIYAMSSGGARRPKMEAWQEIQQY